MDNSKRKVLGSVLGIIIFIICILSLSYAWYRWRSANTDVDIGIHEGGLKFVYSNNNILESSTLSPILDYKDESYYENNNGSLIYADYTTTNTTNDTYKMIIKLNITSISDVLKNSTFKWALLEKNGSSYSKVVEEGDFSSVVVGGNILNEGIYVPPSSPTGSTSTDYRFVIYIDGNQENSSGMMNSTIKADLELCDEKVPLYNISLDDQGATSGQEGTAKIYEKYGVGIYKDSTASTTLMTTTANPITVPSKTGYTFNGYYTSTSCGGDQLISNSGYITSKFSSTYTNKDMTLYACYTKKTYTIAYSLNGGTKGTKAPTSGTYDTDVQISNPTKTVTVNGNANGTGATIGSSVSKAQTFAGWTSSSSAGLSTATARVGTSANPTTAWSGSATKGTYFRNLRTSSGTVTLTATWTPVALTLPTVSKTGYTCKWNTNSSGTGTSYNSGASYTPSATSSATVTLYAICTSNTYNISYKYSGGTKGTNAPTTATYDTDINISNPTKTVTVTGNANGTGATVGSAVSKAQTFAGWTSSSSAGLSTATARVGTSANPTTAWNGSANKGPYFRNLRTSSGTVTLTATWTPVALTLPTVSKTGYTCKWNTNSSGTGTSYNSGASYTPSATSAASVTLYAVCTKNTYTIAYSYNGGTKGTKAPTSGTYDTDVQISNPTKTVKVTGNANGTGATVGSAVSKAQTFAGWTSSSSAGLSTATARVGTSANPTTAWNGSANKGPYFRNLRTSSGTVTLTATWTPVALTLPTVSKTGYTCKWNTNSSGTGTSYNSGASYTPSATSAASVTLYAVCTKNTYTIAYSYNGGTKGTKAPTSGTYDTDVQISNPTKTVTVTGNANGTGATVGSAVSKAQTFAGWTSSGNAGLSTATAKTGTTANPTTNWTGSATKNTYFRNLRASSGTVTLTATWTPVALTLPTVSKTGYTCKWNTNSSGTGTSYNSGASYTPSATSGATVTLYADCDVKSYTVTYNYSANGGTSATKTTATVNYGSAVDLTPTATKSGWTFVGWNTSQSATTKLNSLTMGTSNITLYAIYKKTGQVTFNLNGNTSFNYNGSSYTATKTFNLCTMYNTATSCTASVTMPTITAPANTPTVIGWSNSATNRTATYTSGQTGVTLTSGSTWYAQTRKNAVTLTASFNANGATLSSTASQSCTLATTYNGTAQATSCTVTAPTITRSGYTIDGFNTSASSTSNNSAYNASTKKITLNSSLNNKTWYAITHKNVTATFYYYSSGVKNTKASCPMYNKATTCSITVPTSTFSSTTSQYGASYVGYGAVNTMGTSTATSATISANTSYYVSYRKSVTEYYQNKSRTVYRNAFFTSSSAMSTVLSTSTTGITNLSGASYTANSIRWSWYGYATSSSATSRTYSSVAAAAKSTTTTLYTMYSRSVSATFYYYNGSSQATTTASGAQLANYKASVVSNGNITVPTTVTNSSGPSSTGTNCSGTTTTNTSSYYGVSSSVSSTTKTTPKTNVTKYYAIYKSSFSAYYNKGVGINTIGSTTNSCTNYKTTNGTTYSSSSCNVTLPAINALDGYVSQGWFKGTTTSISSTTGLSPSTSVSLTANACYTARSRYLRADELIYDNTLTGEDCDTAQCMIDRINELIENNSNR